LIINGQLINLYMLQTLDNLNEWNSNFDPWGYETNAEDKKRKDILLSEIPIIDYQNVLDIGCGHGFISRDLPGKKITGVDISPQAISYAQKNNIKPNIEYIESSIYTLDILKPRSFDLIIITGVLYTQYIGNSEFLIYEIINKLLDPKGILISVHIEDWYKAKFPFLLINEYYYNYREYTHKIEIYCK